MLFVLLTTSEQSSRSSRAAGLAPKENLLPLLCPNVLPALLELLNKPSFQYRWQVECSGSVERCAETSPWKQLVCAAAPPNENVAIVDEIVCFDD